MRKTIFIMVIFLAINVQNPGYPTKPHGAKTQDGKINFKTLPRTLVASSRDNG
jgi:hypothetical protein